MQPAQSGEVWLIDLGLAAKVRPCLVLSRHPSPYELALIVVVPHTTSARGNRWEFSASVPFLQPGVFHLQQIRSAPVPNLIRKMGVLPTEVFVNLKARLVRELELL